MRNLWRGSVEKVIIVCGFTLFMILMAFIQVRQFEEQIGGQKQLVYQMLGAYTEGIKGEAIASAILKGAVNEKQIDKGATILRDYGFDKGYVTVYDRQLRNYKSKIFLFYGLIYGAVAVGTMAIIKLQKKRHDDELIELGNILSEFQKGNYLMNSTIAVEDNSSKLNSLLESLGKQLEFNQSRLETEKEATKTLVTDISHQLKTPVASLKMSVSLIQEELKRDAGQEFINLCKKQVDHLENLVQALLNISRLEVGMIVIQKENQKIIDTVIEAINCVYIKADAKMIHIDVENGVNDEILNLKVPHDRKWTVEAIANILDNAIKYSEANTTIQIRLEKNINFLRIEIEDEGMGIDKAEYNWIFKRFYRGSSSKVKQSEGAGVGLYLTRKILEEQGGNITVSPRHQAKGSKFILQLSLT